MTDEKEFSLIDKIDSPADLRKLRVDQLPEVCAELRRFVVDQLSVNPGHLASSLGAMEIAVACHYVFNTPEDRLVWDVGHQAYGHKILTGRRDRFPENRKLGGLCPFPTPLRAVTPATPYRRLSAWPWLQSYSISTATWWPSSAMVP